MKTEELIPHALKTVENSPIPALLAHWGLGRSFKPLCLQSVYSAAAAAQETCAWSTWAFPKSLTKCICGLALVEELITPDRPSAAPVRKGSAPARPAAPASSALMYLKPFFSNTNLFLRTRFGCVPWAGFHFLMWLAGSSDRNAEMIFFFWWQTVEKGSLCQHGAATLLGWHLSHQAASKGENGSDLFGNSLWTCF